MGVIPIKYEDAEWPKMSEGIIYLFPKPAGSQASDYDHVTNICYDQFNKWVETGLKEKAKKQAEDNVDAPEADPGKP